MDEPEGEGLLAERRRLQELARTLAEERERERTAALAEVEELKRQLREAVAQVSERERVVAEAEGLERDQGRAERAARAELAARDGDLAAREAALADREARLEDERGRLDARAAELVAREEEVQRLLATAVPASLLADRQAELEALATELHRVQLQLARERYELDLRERELEDRHAPPPEAGPPAVSFSDGLGAFTRRPRS